MLRKEFIKLSTGMLFGGFSMLNLACSSKEEAGVGTQEHKLTRIGVQLYTVRDLLQTDFEGTMEKVAGLGYQEVEFAGYYDRTPEQIRALLDRLGITAPSSHIGIEALRKDLAGVISASSVMGHRWIVCPALPGNERSADDFKAHAAFFNQVGEACQAAGLRFGYHNHNFEFETMVGDQPAYDFLLKETDPGLVDMELDLYWIKKGGYEPLDYFAKYPGRFKLCHVKDMKPDGDMTAVGQGTMDFAAIFAKGEQAGLQHYFVEHDRPEDAMASIATSINYLKQLRFS